MPELPEVETIVRRLRDSAHEQAPLPGNVIKSVEVTWDKIIAQPDAHTFQKDLIGKTIIDARRRGKFLHFPLNDGHLIGHLRMSGDMRMEKLINGQDKPHPRSPSDRVLFNLSSGWRLIFSNIRKFGRMWYVRDAQTIFDRLGPEPLGDDFSPKLLYEMLNQHSRQIKPLLMDQGFIAGLGNIYTDEALFRAKIHPLQKSDSVSKTEAEALFNAIQNVLMEGIQRFGASLDWIYRGGQFQNYFNVYQQTGKPCPACGAAVQKIAVGQRGTHFCPHCQQAP